MLSEKIKTSGIFKPLYFLAISRLKEPQWYNLWFQGIKKFVLNNIFFVFYVIIDLIIVYNLEMIYKENIQIKSLFFVALAHVYQKIYFTAIEFDFYNYLISKDKYKLILKIGMFSTYFINSSANFSAENDIFVNFKIYNKYIATVFGSLWVLLSYSIFYFTMKLFPAFLDEYRNSRKVIIAALIALIFFIMVNSYAFTDFLADIFVEFDFLALFPSYIIVGFIIYIDPEVSDEKHNILHDVLYSLVYACMQWPFIVGIFRSVYSRFISSQIN